MGRLGRLGGCLDGRRRVEKGERKKLRTAVKDDPFYTFSWPSRPARSRNHELEEDKACRLYSSKHLDDPAQRAERGIGRRWGRVGRRRSSLVSPLLLSARSSRPFPRSAGQANGKGRIDIADGVIHGATIHGGTRLRIGLRVSFH